MLQIRRLHIWFNSNLLETRCLMHYNFQLPLSLMRHMLGFCLLFKLCPCCMHRWWAPWFVSRITLSCTTWDSFLLVIWWMFYGFSRIKNQMPIQALWWICLELFVKAYLVYWIRQAKDVVKAVKKRLQHKNPKVQFLALTVCAQFLES